MAKRRPDHLPPREPNPNKGVKGRGAAEAPSPRKPFIPPAKKAAEKDYTPGKTAFDQELLKDARKFKSIIDQLKEVEAEVSDLKQQKEDLSLSLHNRMLKAGILNVRIEGVGLLSRQVQPFPHIVPGLEKRAFLAMQKLGYGALIVQTVHHKSLQSMVKELRLKNIQKIDGIEVFDKAVTRIYNTTGKKKEEGNG